MRGWPCSSALSGRHQTAMFLSLSDTPAAVRYSFFSQYYGAPLEMPESDIDLMARRLRATNKVH